MKEQRCVWGAIVFPSHLAEPLYTVRSSLSGLRWKKKAKTSFCRGTVPTTSQH